MRILVADDDPISRRLLQTYLERWGHEVTLAVDGAEAWALFEAGAFPIVITDWMMPGVDGVELVRRIRARPPAPDQIPYVYVILLTAKTQKDDLVLGMDAGADDFVAKPFDRDELRARLREGERIIQLERDLREQNRALSEAQAALIETEKAASAGKLAADTARELSGPLEDLSRDLARLRQNVAAALASAPEGGDPSVRQRLDREFERVAEDLQRIQAAVGRLREQGIDGLP